MPHDSTPELRRVADALTRTPAPLTPLRLALAERAATTGANVVRASLPPLAGLTGAAAEATKAARPVRVAGEELLGVGPGADTAGTADRGVAGGRVARAVAVRVSAVVSPAAEPGVMVAVTPV